MPVAAGRDLYPLLTGPRTIPPPVRGQARGGTDMINLLPKDTVFFDLFENIVQRVVVAAEHLRHLARNFPNGQGDIQQIRNAEHEADEFSHKALDRLDRTFITPFD